MNSVSSVAGISPPATTVARLRCTSLPTPVASAAGNMPTVATAAVISTGRSRSPAPVSTASNSGTPCSRMRLRFATMMTPFMTATPNSAMKPTPDATLSVVPVEMQRDQPAERRERHDAEIKQHLAQHAEFGIEQHHHRSQHHADDQREARLRPLLTLELPAPFDVIFFASKATLFCAMFFCASASSEGDRGRGN